MVRVCGYIVTQALSAQLYQHEQLGATYAEQDLGCLPITLRSDIPRLAGMVVDWEAYLVEVLPSQDLSKRIFHQPPEPTADWQHWLRSADSEGVQQGGRLHHTAYLRTVSLVRKNPKTRSSHTDFRD